MKKAYILSGLVGIVLLAGVVSYARADVSLWDKIADRVAQIIADKFVVESEPHFLSSEDSYMIETFGATTGGLRATTTGEIYNVIGTRVGTTTTGVGFGSTGSGGFSATTTYPVFIGTDTEQVSFFFDVVNASTTPNGKVAVSFLSSNDFNCQASITTSPDNIPTAEQIKWYDAGYHLVNLAGANIQGTGTTTVTFTVLPGQNREITLNNLSSRCIGLAVSGSSTELQVQAVRKGSLSGF